MTREEAKGIIQGKLNCMNKCDTFECKCTDECDNCEYCYSQGNFSEQKKAFEIAIESLVTDTNVGGKWILCSERLPKCNGCYLVWRPHFFGGEIGMPAICYFDGQDTWHDSYGVDFTRILNKSDVVARQPLPEPYKEE